jgi:hypothetical protein
MDECLQEWSSQVERILTICAIDCLSCLNVIFFKEKCYNDIVHVRIRSDQVTMDVYCTYAHRPMVRSFNLRTMTFDDEHLLIRDSHPPMDSESSYVMLTIQNHIVTAGYQGDYIPTIRTTHGKALLYALRSSTNCRIERVDSLTSIE